MTNQPDIFQRYFSIRCTITKEIKNVVNTALLNGLTPTISLLGDTFEFVHLYPQGLAFISDQDLVIPKDGHVSFNVLFNHDDFNFGVKGNFRIKRMTFEATTYVEFIPNYTNFAFYYVDKRNDIKAKPAISASNPVLSITNTYDLPQNEFYQYADTVLKILKLEINTLEDQRHLIHLNLLAEAQWNNVCAKWKAYNGHLVNEIINTLFHHLRHHHGINEVSK